MTLTELSKQIADQCSDAYSVQRYRSWSAVARWLLKQGFNAEQTEAIMRSKWTRWAADHHGAYYGAAPAKALEPFLDDLREDADGLVAGTI